MLKTFCDCHIKYCLRYDKDISAPQNDKFAIQGKNLHALASYYLKKYPIDKFLSILTENEHTMWENLKRNEYFNMEIIASELSVMTKISDNWVGGRLDALVKDSDNNYYILDYKTGSIPQDAENDYQTIIYFLCCDNKIKDYNSLNFVYINVKENEIKKIKFIKESQQKYTKKINDTINQIYKLNTDKTRDTNKCLYCEYNKICI